MWRNDVDKSYIFPIQLSECWHGAAGKNDSLDWPHLRVNPPLLGSERPVVLAGQRDVESVVEGSSFSLECHVSVPVNIDTRVTIMWKHEDLVLQADNVKVRHDPNMNITLVKKTSVDMRKTSYSTYLAVAVTEKKYQGSKLGLLGKF